MIKTRHLYIFFPILFTFIVGCGNNESEVKEAHKEVIMRKIGHEILMLSNDSTSIVNPIINDGNEYRIQFATQFGFKPEELINAIDTIIKQTSFSTHYLVQVEKCKTNEVVYSYETTVFSDSPFPDEVACGLREQPEDCYEIVLHFIDEGQQDKNFTLYMMLLLIFMAAGAYFYFKKKQKKINDNRIVIGACLYDPKQMTLTLINNIIELTSKESELLNILNESVNETVDRETLLNRVWGDEGDYVGRTLDVYISKLRKKLENDTSIEIKNIRGIGYKLIVK